jgi:hypothetical protein
MIPENARLYQHKSFFRTYNMRDSCSILIKKRLAQVTKMGPRSFKPGPSCEIKIQV